MTCIVVSVIYHVCDSNINLLSTLNLVVSGMQRSVGPAGGAAVLQRAKKPDISAVSKKVR